MATLVLIGAGRIGRVHAANVAAHPGCRLRGIVDVSPNACAELAQRHDVEMLTLEAALDGDADAVLIASATDTHADLIERAAAAGKAIFCEKPIDLDIGRASAAVSCAKAHGVPLAVGFNRRFDKCFAALKGQLDAGAIGAPEIVTITSRDPSPPPADYVRVSGGLFRDMTIHDLDMARWLLGEEPVEIHTMASALVDDAIAAAGDVDTAVVTLRTASGRLCQISNSRRAVYGYDQRIECHGPGGMLRAGNVHETTVELADTRGATRAPIMHFFLERYADAYRAELDAFVAGLGAAHTQCPDGDDGIAALRLADAAQASHDRGEPVRIEAG